MKGAVSIKALCPYYIDNSACMIRCRRSPSDTVTVHVAFASRKECLAYRARRCNRERACRKCPVYEGFQVYGFNGNNDDD